MAPETRGGQGAQARLLRLDGEPWVDAWIECVAGTRWGARLDPDQVRAICREVLGTIAQRLDGQAAREDALAREALLATDALEMHLGRIAEGFLAMDRELRIVYVNHAAEEIMSRSLEELRGVSIWEAFPQLVGTEVGRAYEDALLSGRQVEGTFYFEPWNRWYDVRAFPSETGLSTYFRDRTDFVLHQQERERILEIIDVADPLVVTDRDLRINFVNASVVRASGRSKEDFHGRVLWEASPFLTDPKLRFWHEFNRLMRDRVPVEFEEYYEPRNAWFYVTAYPTRDGGMAAFARDITDRKRSQELQERLLGVVGHDLRNPLAAVRVGVSRVAARQDLPEDVRVSLDRALRATARMQRMITALLDYSRLHEAGGFPLECQRLDAAELVQQVVTEFSEAHPDRLASVAGEPLPVRWDSERIMQALGNLVGNALFHGAPGMPVTVEAHGDEAHVRLSVHNHGPPIPDDIRRDFFQPFRRRHGGGGLGLGLYIAATIVHQHGGRIDFDSAPGRGTTFALVLPREPDVTCHACADS